jgi:hypothetical protein
VPPAADAFHALSCTAGDHYDDHAEHLTIARQLHHWWIQFRFSSVASTT